MSAIAPAPRVPWRATAATLVAIACLGATLGTWLLLVPLAALFLAHYLVDARLPQRTWVVWTVRLALFGGVIWLHSADPNMYIDFGRLYGASIDLAGELAAAEIVVQAWKRQPSGGRRGEATLLLSLFVILAAFNVDIRFRWPHFVAPVYFVFVAFAIRATRARGGAVASGGASIALLLALVGGGALAVTIFQSREALTRLDMSVFGFFEWKTVNLNDSPRLGKGPRDGGSLDRALVVQGELPEPHLRGMVFDVYKAPGWFPLVAERTLLPASGEELHSHDPGPRTRITRLSGPLRFLFAPLNASGVELERGEPPTWDKTGGCTLALWRMEPLAWDVILPPSPVHQGPLCRPPSAEERRACLEVPTEIRPEVRELARRIAGDDKSPLEKVAAVMSYLPSHHRYSLEVDPGRGEPISNFLLNGLDAHCEYFAAASAILLRCVGVPARYVVGFYAHEETGRGRMVVRSRDAHAWAEAWVEGIGWVTVESTPADGRPDRMEKASVLRRAIEWIKDRWQDVKKWFVEFTWKKAGILLAGALAIFFLAKVLLALWMRLRRRTRREKAFVYSGGDETLAAIAGRFERALRRRGRACPEERTWRAHCDGDSALLAFVATYEAARFGARMDRGALEEGLRRIEQSH